MPCPDGYSKFNRIRVIDACEKYIKDREDRIERKSEELIQKEMFHGIKFLGRTWFSKNREQAIKSLAAGDCWSDFHCLWFTGFAASAKVEEILTMAKVSEEESIFLSEEIIRHIAKFMV